MATSTTNAVMVPLEEYLRTSYEHDCEWVDGEVRERSMPDEFHSALQVFFIGYFLRLNEVLGIRVRSELRVRVAAGRYRIPDVTVLPAGAPFVGIPETPPMICIEILSPDDRAWELQEKLDDYVAMGVEAIWVVDPRRRRLSKVDADGTHRVTSFRVPHSDFVITPEEMFAELDALEAGAAAE